MHQRFHKRIIQHLADTRYQPADVEQLADELSIAADERAMFEQAVAHLIEEGQVVVSSASLVSLPPPGRQFSGIIRVHERGFAFIVPDSPTEHGDLFVPEGNTMGAMTGDRVRAKVYHEKGRRGGGRSPYTGRVVEIIQRADKQYVGTLQQRGGAWCVVVDGKFLHDPIVIRDPHAKNAKAGDKVVVELLEYPTENKPGEGVISEVLGEAGEPDVETRSTMRAYGLKERFPAEVLEEARAAAKQFDDNAVPAGRMDLTSDFIITIDPPDAKDYDDAISIRRIGGEGQGPRAKGQGEEEGAEGDVNSILETRNSKLESSPGPRPSSLGPSAAWELGVHIAHVSTFVQPGGALDTEAYSRGNSCYLPRRVVPMLPELLSNGVCSLQEGVNRFCLSVFIQFDAGGNVLGQRFCRSVIRSAKRLTYLEAQALIDDDIKEARRHAKTEPKYPTRLIQTLKLMDELAKVIRQRRLRDGMIVLGLPAVELIFDDTGRVADARPEDDAFTHKLIEMFMVEANEAAARLFDSMDVPMIRRIHPDPPAHDMSALKQFARVAGYNIPQTPTRKELQTLLDSVRGKPAQQAVHFAVLRTLSQAEYSPLLIGHFALASEHYTHFTSPIRRYPDLIVHRGLDAYLDAVESHQRSNQHGHSAHHGGRRRENLIHLITSDKRVPDEGRLHEMGRHCSGTERNAAAAESDLRTYLVMELLAAHLGDDYEGTVTGVTGGGVFVQLDRFLVDGFISVADVSRAFGTAGDRFTFNRTTGALVAMRSGRTISIGNRFIVRVAAVDPVRRKLDLAIIKDLRGANEKGDAKPADRKPPNAKPGEPKHRQSEGARRAHQQAMDLKRNKKGKHRKGKRRT